MVNRLWGRIRRCLCDEWERDNQRSYWWGGEGKPVERCMWRHAAVDELVVSSGADAAAVTFLSDART
eukprot:11031041-Karenia_brevis.AAC.1